ncbi:MAG TPA: thermonuclease family protein [Gammaproteobacteria bacterium]
MTQQTVDRYGRIVGEVYRDGAYINAEMVRHGFAWAYRKYSNNPKLLDLESDARQHKRGLWTGGHQVPPWEWQKARREEKPEG